MEYFLITLKQISLMLAYVFTGILLRKTKKFGESASKVIAAFLIYVSSPCYTIISMTESFSLEKISTYIEMFLIGCAVLAFFMIISILVLTKFFAKEGYMKNVYKYLFAFANVGFFGNPLVEAVFGGDGLVQYMIFSLPMNLAISTYGFIILTDNGEKKTKSEYFKHIVKVLLVPSVISMFVGLGLGLCSVKLPPIVKDFLNPAAVCYTALPMILLGCVLGNFTFKSLVSNPKSYAVAVIKLVILPLIALGFSALAHILGANDFTCVLIALMSALPPGMNVVTYPESFGMDGSEGARALFISYILSLITIPVVVISVMAILGI